jgi:16S rRNA pseudouridine516 synthase
VSHLLLKYLANLGYGSRREVLVMFDDRRVTHVDGGRLAHDDAFTHDVVRVDGEPLDPAPGVALMLHKPAGYVCSTRDASRLIYELLPGRFPRRSPVIAPIGRLDRDTSGLLLLTDDGQLNHRITSPRSHLSRKYEVTLANDLRGDEVEVFASGRLMLDGETTALKPVRLDVIDARHGRVTLTEGRYHQVKRMFAAVGNHVVALHRSAIGGLTLGDLAAGHWRILAETDMAKLFS